MNVQRLGGAMAIRVALTLVALVFAGMVPFGFNLLVGREYGPSSLGEVSAVLGLALFLAQVPSTIGIAATKFMAEAIGRGDECGARSVFQYLFVLNFALTGVLTLGMAIASPWLAHALHVASLTVLLGAVILPVYSLYLFFKSVYYGIQHVGAYVWNEIASDIAFFLLLGATVLTHQSPLLLVPFILNNAIFAAIAGYHLAVYFHDFSWFPSVEKQEILVYWLLNGGGTAASLGRSLLGTTVVGLFLQHHAVGLYAAAIALTSPLQLMPRALALVLFSTMARLYGSGRGSSVRDLLNVSTEGLIFALGFLCSLLILNAQPILALLFRPGYTAATIATQLVIFGSYLLMISSPAISALSSTKYIKIPTIAAFLGLGISMAIWLLLIPRFGIDGAALGFATGSAITGCIPVAYAYRIIGGRSASFVRATAVAISLVVALYLTGRTPLVASLIFSGLFILIYARPAIVLVRESSYAYHSGTSSSLADSTPPS